MYYIIYKVTNKINGKIYIGSHKTKDLNDNYMGSGKYLVHSQNLHGLENFEKEILFVFDNPEEMYTKEAEIVNTDFIAEENTYNLKIGGHGGFDYINNTGKHIYPKHKEQAIISLKGGRKKLKKLRLDDEWSLKNSKNLSSGVQKYYKDGGLNGFSDKKHSEDTKNKIGLKSAKHQKGNGNSQYNTMWIYSQSEKQSKKIRKNEIIPDGWIKGRKINFS